MIVSVLTQDPYLLVESNTVLNNSTTVVGFSTDNGQTLTELLVMVKDGDELMTMKYLDVLDQVNPYISAKLRKRLNNEQNKNE